MYYLHVHIETDHVKLNKPRQHWTNIRGFAPNLNIGDPDGRFAGEGLVDADDFDVEDDGGDGDDADPKVGDKEPSSVLPRYLLVFKGRDLSTASMAARSPIKADLLVCQNSLAADE